MNEENMPIANVESAGREYLWFSLLLMVVLTLSLGRAYDSDAHLSAASSEAHR